MLLSIGVPPLITALAPYVWQFTMRPSAFFPAGQSAVRAGSDFHILLQVRVLKLIELFAVILVYHIFAMLCYVSFTVASPARGYSVPNE
jgi:hypothetical protein